MNVTQRNYGGALEGSALTRWSNQIGNSKRPSDDELLDSYGDNTWIYACVQLIQTKGAGVPLKVYTQRNGKPEELPNHALARLLEYVNPVMNGYDLRESNHGYIELCGLSYWLLNKIVDNKPTELCPLIPSFVFPKFDKTGLTGYDYKVNGLLIKTFKPDEIICFKTWNPTNPFIGLAPGVPARDVAEMILNSDRYNAAFIKNGATAGGFLTSDKTILEPIKKLILEVWNKLHRGPKNVNKVAILDGGLKWEGTSVTHNDMQFTELQKTTIRSLLAAFRIQPVMLGIHDDSNYSNAKEQRRAFWVDSMIPRLRKIESTLNESLAPLFGKDIYVEHDLNGVEDLQEDQKTKAERDQIYVVAGIKTINEVREELGLDAVAWGDTWNAPMGLMAIEDHSAPVAPPTPEIPAPAKPQGEPAKAATVDKGFLRRTMIWSRFKGQTEMMERRWAPVLRRLFTGQEREVIANVRAHWRKAVFSNPTKDAHVMKQDISVILFERGEARRLFQREGRRLIEFTLSEKARQEIEDFDLGVQFQVTNPRVTTAIENRAFKFANEVNLTTEEALRSGLIDAIAAGESIADVEKRIEDIFDIARGSRTQMIARTEVISASNQGAIAAYEQSGVVEGIEWISSRDEKVRDSHRIDGDTINLNGADKFENGLKFPGDPEAPAEEVINCRCTTAPIVSKE